MCKGFILKPGGCLILTLFLWRKCCGRFWRSLQISLLWIAQGPFLFLAWWLLRLELPNPRELPPAWSSVVGLEPPYATLCESWFSWPQCLYVISLGYSPWGMALGNFPGPWVLTRPLSRECEEEGGGERGETGKVGKREMMMTIWWWERGERWNVYFLVSTLIPISSGFFFSIFTSSSVRSLGFITAIQFASYDALLGVWWCPLEVPQEFLRGAVGAGWLLRRLYKSPPNVVTSLLWILASYLSNSVFSSITTGIIKGPLKVGKEI